MLLTVNNQVLKWQSYDEGQILLPRSCILGAIYHEDLSYQISKVLLSPPLILFTTVAVNELLLVTVSNI